MRIWHIFAFFLIMIIFTGQKLYLSDKEYDIERDIYNMTNQINVSLDFEYSYPKQDKEVDIDITRGLNIVFKFVDFLVFAYVEAIKWALEFGYTHAESITLQAFLTLFYWIVVIIIIGIIVPLIIPLIALVYLSYIGSRELYRRYKGRKR